MNLPEAAQIAMEFLKLARDHSTSKAHYLDSTHVEPIKEKLALWGLLASVWDKAPFGGYLAKKQLGFALFLGIDSHACEGDVATRVEPYTCHYSPCRATKFCRAKMVA